MGNIRSGGTQYTRAYSELRGVELGGTGAEISKNRLAYSENLYRDYYGEDGSILESIPGYRRIGTLGGRVHSIILQLIGEGEEYLVIHAGDKLYRMKLDERDEADAIKTVCEGAPDKRCAHFSHGGAVYLIFPDGILVIGEDGAAHTVGEAGALPYSPTLTYNGEAYEQKNLIADTFKTKYGLVRPHEYSYGTPEVRYKILDSELHTCAVAGIDRGFADAVYVPTYAKIGGERYRVVEVAPMAFSSATALTAIYVGEGVELIGERAFSNCSAATVIQLPSSVHTVGDAAFEGCGSMLELFLGSGLTKLGSSLFSGCGSLEKIYYTESEDQFKLIAGYEECTKYYMGFSDDYAISMLLLPLAEPSPEVLGVYENGEERRYTTVMRKGLVEAVRVETDISWRYPAEFTIDARLADADYDFSTGRAAATGKAAILGCTVAEVFDNRVFLSGNPAFPNTVFYSAPERGGRDNPLYFGALSYFNDGVGGYGVRALLAVNDSLAVFKSGDDGSGSIFYHTPLASGESLTPRIYPTSYVHSGLCAVGGALTFMDDPVFVTGSGLYALDKKRIDYDRSVVCRSHNVNYDLQKEDLSRAILTEWCGYLVLICGERAYLADSRSTFTHRTGGVEYEWFVIDGLGSFEGGETVYRFDTLERGEIQAADTPGEIFSGIPHSLEYEGELLLYGEVGGVKYSLYTEGELAGGKFSPLTAALGCGELLFFGTEGGALMIFNNDKRGTPPEAIRAAADFDEEEYAAVMGARIHPYYYSREGRAVRYAMRTAYDNCGIPHLTKSTVKGSLVLRCKSCSSATVRCEVGTETSDYVEVTSFPGGSLSFAEVDLGSLALSTADYHTLPIAERAKRWVDKQISIYSEGYASPIGISKIAYRYTVDGRVKNRA